MMEKKINMKGIQKINNIDNKVIPKKINSKVSYGNKFIEYFLNLKKIRYVYNNEQNLKNAHNRDSENNSESFSNLENDSELFSNSESDNNSERSSTKNTNNTNNTIKMSRSIENDVAIIDKKEYSDIGVQTDDKLSVKNAQSHKSKAIGGNRQLSFREKKQMNPFEEKNIVKFDSFEEKQEIHINPPEKNQTRLKKQMNPFGEKNIVKFDSSEKKREIHMNSPEKNQMDPFGEKKDIDMIIKNINLTNKDESGNKNKKTEFSSKKRMNPFGEDI